MKLYEDIKNVLAKQNMNLVVGTIYDLQQIWLQWYRGSVNDFHYYNVTCNGKQVTRERKTMNAAKMVCEEMTKLLWTERTKIELDTPEKTKKLWEVLDSKRNSFTVNFSTFLEKSLAIGSGLLVEYQDNNEETIIDYVNGDVIIPFKYTNSYIEGIITVSRFIEGTDKNKTYYTHLTIHEYSNGVYTKTNELYKSKNVDDLGKKVDFETKFPDVEEKQEYKTDTPHFQFYKPNLANNFDINSPMGISYFANSIDRLKSLDMKYDSFYMEFKLGKKRIMVDPSAMKATTTADENGNVRQVQYFDTEDEVYVGINGMENQPVKEVDFSIKAQEHIDAINAELNWLSDNLGLGSGYWKFDGDQVRTATEVISENSKAYRTREHFAIILLDVVYDLVRVICNLNGIETKNITITLDDSIIEDKDAIRLKDMQEYTAGLLSKKQYLLNRGYNEKQVENMIKEINEEKMSNQDAFGFIGDEA